MKRIFLLVLLSLCNTFLYAQLNRKATEALIKRVVPEQYQQFSVEQLPAVAGKDLFEIESKKGKVILRGSNGVNVASALHHYLKTHCNTEITWNTTKLNLPKKLPVVPQKVQLASPYKHRYYLNYCTYNYTMVWWDWERWEKEIDWMALHGINMPLALTGQDAVWQRVYKSMGLKEEELKEFFSGPAYSGFNWMGLLDGWGGPLPQNWINFQEKLQKRKLERERSLGMKPVLPAFNGHVPTAFKKKYPNVAVDRIKWVRFRTDMLHPKDPMFTTIGEKFINELKKTFGTDHFYSADAFIEVVPPSSDPEYLRAMANTMYKSMAIADPKATWVMQGWMFHHKKEFWQPTQIKSFLDGVPDDNILVLDLFSENKPVWSRTEAFYGKPWIWNMLHNFGGNISLYGRMPSVANGPAEALNGDGSGRLSGIGLTMEGLEQNPVMYSLMLENTWRNKPINVEQWLKGYVTRRYGTENEHLDKAWQILKSTVYDGSLINGGPESIITGRPTFNKTTTATRANIFYNPVDLLPAWEHFVKAIPEIERGDGFEYDLVDVTRQVMANYAQVLQQNYASAVKAKQMDKASQYSKQFITLIDDLDEVLATRKEFLLGVWLENAKALGTNLEERNLYEKNARMIITLWGDEHGLYDYSNRQWAGLMKNFYKRRWENFFQFVEDSHKKGIKVNIDEFNNSSKALERAWVYSHDLYANKPVGDSRAIVKKMYDKYFDALHKSY